MHGTAQSVAVVPFSHPSSPDEPLLFEQAPDGSGRLVVLGLASVALALFSIPYFLVGAHLVADASARAVLVQRPLLGANLSLGVAVLIVLFGWLLVRQGRQALARRRVTISGGLVHSTAVGLFGGKSWSEPLGAYRGVAPRVRSSLSGVCHDLVLVHPQPERCVLLYSGQVITPDMIAAASRILAIAEIPSREASSFTPLHGVLQPSEPQPRIAA